jgi:hypothetical protein
MKKEIATRKNERLGTHIHAITQSSKPSSTCTSGKREEAGDANGRDVGRGRGQGEVYR